MIVASSRQVRVAGSSGRSGMGMGPEALCRRKWRVIAGMLAGLGSGDGRQQLVSCHTGPQTVSRRRRGNLFLGDNFTFALVGMKKTLIFTTKMLSEVVTNN